LSNPHIDSTGCGFWVKYIQKKYSMQDHIEQYFKKRSDIDMYIVGEDIEKSCVSKVDEPITREIMSPVNLNSYPSHSFPQDRGLWGGNS